MKNIFNSWFKKQVYLKEPVDLSILKVDLHSHLIPAIDDGSKSMEESITLIKQLLELGYKKIITTPHIQFDYYKNTPEIISDGLDKLKNALLKESLFIEIEAAAEYLVDDGFMAKIEKENLLTFGNKNILIELPYTYEPPNLNNILFELQIRGYKIVLAHPERYGYWHQNLNKLEDLHLRGIMLQMNINSLTGWYSSESKKMAEQLIDKKLISFLGSDLHNNNYLQELKKSRFEPALQNAIQSNPIKNASL